jgi:hypothetical protein
MFLPFNHLSAQPILMINDGCSSPSPREIAMRWKVFFALPPHLGVVFCIMPLFCLPCHAKLTSTKNQEASMVGRAAPVSEKWVRLLNDTYGKKDPYAQEVVDLCKEIGGYEDGVMNDMSIANDVGRLVVYAQRKDRLLFRAIDEFDNAAEQLGGNDRMRYYAAKAQIRSACRAPAIDSIKREWLSGIINDCCRATRNGQEVEKSIGPVRRFTERNGLKERAASEAACRITVEYARYFLTEAKLLHLRHDDKKAFKTALRGIKEIPALSPLDTALCAKWKSQDELLSLYDSCFVRPLSVCAGARSDELKIEVCNRYWQQRKLVASVIVRIRTPSSDAFDLFEKAGNDVILQHDGRIAAAELALWKKAGKGKEFKKKYPERWQLARRIAALRR